MLSPAAEMHLLAILFHHHDEPPACQGRFYPAGGLEGISGECLQARTQEIPQHTHTEAATSQAWLMTALSMKSMQQIVIHNTIESVITLF